MENLHHFGIGSPLPKSPTHENSSILVVFPSSIVRAVPNVSSFDLSAKSQIIVSINVFLWFVAMPDEKEPPRGLRQGWETWTCVRSERRLMTRREIITQVIIWENLQHHVSCAVWVILKNIIFIPCADGLEIFRCALTMSATCITRKRITAALVMTGWRTR